MIPTTPSGTRTWRISSPLGRTVEAIPSPTGSGRAAVCRRPSAMALMRPSSRCRRSRNEFFMPRRRAASQSSSFAAKISGISSVSASAMAKSASFFTAVRVAARRRAAAWASLACCQSRALISIALPPSLLGKISPLHCQPHKKRKTAGGRFPSLWHIGPASSIPAL